MLNGLSNEEFQFWKPAWAARPSRVWRPAGQTSRS